MSERSPAELIEEFISLTNPQAKAPRAHAFHLIEMLRSSGYEISSPDAALVAERDALKAVVLETGCPRPANDQPDGQSVKDCVALGYCGCCYGAALSPEHQREGK